MPQSNFHAGEPPFLTLFEVSAHLLLLAPRDGDTARSGVLEHAAVVVEGVEEAHHLLRHAVEHHYDICGVHLHYACAMLAYGTRYVGVIEHGARRQFVEAGLTEEQFVISVILGLYHVYLLLDELIGNDVQRRIGDLGLRKNPDDVRRLLRSYSRNIATQASKSLIRRDLSSNEDTPFNEDTLDKYLELLDTMYITDDLEPWAPSIRSKVRVQGMKTRHLSDPSLAVASLGLSPEALIKDFRTFGFLFESYAIRDLRVYSSILNGRLYHYRDSKGLEADAVMELRDHRWAMFEVKLFDPARVDEGAANLLKIKGKIDTNRMNEPSFMMVITAGKYARQRADGVYEVPVSLLAP